MLLAMLKFRGLAMGRCQAREEAESLFEQVSWDTWAVVLYGDVHVAWLCCQHDIVRGGGRITRLDPMPSSLPGTCARATDECHPVLIALVSEWTYPWMEILAYPGIATATQHHSAFRRDLKVEGSRVCVETVLPPRPSYPPAVFSNDNCERRPRL
jgi:hypothetical protein